MAKNPFVDCKSRKRRKRKNPIVPKPKLFCPRTMVRFDGSPSEFITMWCCKMCMLVLLSDRAVLRHIQTCKEITIKPAPIEIERVSRYVCDVCSKIFNRHVAFRNHKEEHEMSVSKYEESDDETINTKKPRKSNRKKGAKGLLVPKLEHLASDDEFYFP